MTRPDEHREDIGEKRREVGSQSSSKKHPPHVSQNAEDEPIQEEMPSPGAAPVMPANASGTDTVGTAEQAQPVDDESMYDGRPDEDKDQPPSERSG